MAWTDPEVLEMRAARLFFFECSPALLGISGNRDKREASSTQELGGIRYGTGNDRSIGS